MPESSVATMTTNAGVRAPLSRRPYRLARLLHRRPGVLTGLLLLSPLAWFLIVYLGSLLALLAQSFFTLDEMSGQVVREISLDTFRALIGSVAHLDIVLRTVGMAAAVTLACAAIGFPIAYFMARHTSDHLKALFYLGVMLPMWASYLVKVYAWRQILAQEGVITWLLDGIGQRWLMDSLLALPVIGGPSLTASYLGMFLVFTYLWLPFMILPIQAALERVPASLDQASADLGARPRQTFVHVTLPLALPGVVAGSVFTFSLTLGDYIVPSVVGAPGYFIGMMVYQLQGTSGNIPLAAAFSVVPILIMAVYLTIAKRKGAFDAL